MSGIIGKKIGMTNLYDAEGKHIPCTIIEAGPCVVTQVKTKSTDGYEAVQLSFDERREKSTPAPLKGHFKKANTTPKRKVVEFLGFTNTFKTGDTVKVDIFAEGDFVDVIGTAKGKGFQGVVKRHGFSGVGGSTHGQHDRSRAPGSMGAGSDPSRVFPGKRLPGRTGNHRVKAINLKVMKVLADKNLLVVKGNVAGAKGGYLVIEK